MKLNNIHILGISETHLETSFESSDLGVDVYTLFRKDLNKYGGGVAVYVQNQIPVKIRSDLVLDVIEALWIQVHLPQTKPILAGCCYRIYTVRCWTNPVMKVGNYILPGTILVPS